MSSIEATLTASQLRWTGHIISMNDSRLPKAVFYGELTEESSRGLRTLSCLSALLHVRPTIFHTASINSPFVCAVKM